MSFLTEDDLRTRLNVTLHVDATEEPWLTTVRDANEAAYGEILSRLAWRGYTKAQVDTWSRGAEFQTDIGLWWCLVKGGVADPERYNREFLDMLARRFDDLDSVALLDADGELIVPGAGRVGYGTIESPSRFINPRLPVRVDHPAEEDQFRRW